MSAMPTKTEFAFNAGATYAQPLSTVYGATSHRAGMGSRLAAAVQWLTEAPRRRAVINELESLNDHELADIGLSRADLPRVFDHDFGAARRR